MQVALVTGASRGLGLALARRLARDGYALVIDARAAAALDAAAPELAADTTQPAIAGDVADPDHRAALITAAWDLGGLDLLVNNASSLGPTPQPALADDPIDTLRAVYEVNVLAPLALAAAAAAIVAAAGAGWVVSLIVFGAGSVASLLLLRPFVRSHIRQAPQMRTGTDALVGAHARVLERVDGNGGRVKIGAVIS